MVAVAPIRTFTSSARASVGTLPLTKTSPYLPTDFSAARRDMVSLALWLFLTTLIRKFTRMLLIGIAAAILTEMVIAVADQWRRRVRWPSRARRPLELEAE